uniref:Ig-like domain-containing protein n=1 Tax=Sus scrofa TaxID=9823 RepID=A0A8D1T2T3_PIG
KPYNSLPLLSLSACPEVPGARLNKNDSPPWLSPAVAVSGGRLILICFLNDHQDSLLQRPHPWHMTIRWGNQRPLRDERIQVVRFQTFPESIKLSGVKLGNSGANTCIIKCGPQKTKKRSVLSLLGIRQRPQITGRGRQEREKVQTILNCLDEGTDNETNLDHANRLRHLHKLPQRIQIMPKGPTFKPQSSVTLQILRSRDCSDLVASLHFSHLKMSDRSSPGKLHTAELPTQGLRPKPPHPKFGESILVQHCDTTGTPNPVIKLAEKEGAVPPLKLFSDSFLLGPF